MTQQRVAFRCGHCHSKLGVRTHKAGKQVRCPQCQSQFRLPSPRRLERTTRRRRPQRSASDEVRALIERLDSPAMATEATAALLRRPADALPALIETLRAAEDPARYGVVLSLFGEAAVAPLLELAAREAHGPAGSAARMTLSLMDARGERALLAVLESREPARAAERSQAAFALLLMAGRREGQRDPIVAELLRYVVGNPRTAFTVEDLQRFKLAFTLLTFEPAVLGVEDGLTLYYRMLRANACSAGAMAEQHAYVDALAAMICAHLERAPALVAVPQIAARLRELVEAMAASAHPTLIVRSAELGRALERARG